jgi:hypothetical protein
MRTRIVTSPAFGGDRILGAILFEGTMDRDIGMEERSQLIRLHGLREIATGIGILSQDDPTPWIWGRVVGDVLDLGTLATGLRPENRQRANVRLAIAAVAGAMTLDVLCARALATEAEDRRRHPRRIRDYSGRRGMVGPPAAMRGAARDFPIPRDMRIPEALRPHPVA